MASKVVTFTKPAAVPVSRSSPSAPRSPLVRTGTKPAPASTAAQTRATAAAVRSLTAANTAAAAAQARNDKLIAAGQAAVAKLVKPETYTAAGALDFGISTLKSAGLLPGGLDPAAGPSNPQAGSTSTTAPAGALSSNLVPLALAGVAVWLFLKS